MIGPKINQTMLEQVIMRDELELNTHTDFFIVGLLNLKL